jgi:hypothetical protein
LDDNRKPVVNLSDVTLEDAAYSALGKGLNYAVAHAVLPIEDFLSGEEKAVGALPEKAAEEVRQETVRILKASRKPEDNLSGAERRTLRTQRTNADLTALPADKGKAAVVLNTSDYNRNIEALSGALLIGCCSRTPLRPWTGRPPAFSRSNRFTGRSYNSCGHRVRGLLHCTGSRRSRRKVTCSSPSSAQSAPQPIAWPSIWIGSLENTWETLHAT